MVARLSPVGRGASTKRAVRHGGSCLSPCRRGIDEAEWCAMAARACRLFSGASTKLDWCAMAARACRLIRGTSTKRSSVLWRLVLVASLLGRRGSGVAEWCAMAARAFVALLVGIDEASGAPWRLVLVALLRGIEEVELYAMAARACRLIVY
ncbi:hypothetical protein MRX96_053128 [Rhipicephalus microplus]